MVFSGTPSGVPAATDCAIRQLAWEYGRKLQPARGGFQTLYDALQLGACNVTRPPAAAELDEIFAPLAEPIPRVSGQRVLFVDTAAHADDGAAGTYATLAGAVAASRGLPKPLTIALRAGTHHLPRTVDLTAADSGLTIRNAPGERAEVSGGRNLTTKWRPSSRCKGCWEASLKGQVTNVPGLRRDGVREIRARFPNYDPERDAVIGGEHLIHDGHVGWVNATTTWVAQGSGGMNGVPGPWPPTAQATTHVISAEDWPGVEWPMNITTNGAGRPDMWTGEGGWGQFWVGVGGTCIDRSPPAGYWCSEPAAPRGISTPNHPSGFSPTAADLPNMPYKDPAGAVVHAWRPGHWYTNIFEVGRSHADASAAGSSLMFSRGGTQGGEGVTGGEEWYIENVIEELDIGREWWFDNTTQMLYYKPNATAGTAPTGAFVATDLRVLFNITGSQAAPAHHIAIKGLTLRDTSYAYFEPHGLPSGGDWGLQKQGAVTLVGTENVEVSSSLFTRLDGNAVFIGGYNRNLTIDANEFVYIGDSAIAAWGDTSTRLNANGSVTLPYPIGPDGRGGDQPRGTRITNNLAHEIGLWQKQSSLYFQAVATQTLVKGNVFFNGPRAALNFNDGFGGGDEITENLLLNTCRESSDHGPWNSWDRVPYITTLRTGKASIIPADRHIHHNFVLGTYNVQAAIDTDDGSSYYQTYDNFLAYAGNGMKSDYGGHDHVWTGNIIAYAGTCFDFGFDVYANTSFRGYNDAFVNNICLFRSSYQSDCNWEHGLDKSVRMNDNNVSSGSGKLTICNEPWADWHKNSRDTGTTLGQWPTDGALLSMAKRLLSF